MAPTPVFKKTWVLTNNPLGNRESGKVNADHEITCLQEAECMLSLPLNETEGKARQKNRTKQGNRTEQKALNCTGGNVSES